MYNILLNREHKYVPACIINGNNVTVIDTLFDTGAKFTCYSAVSLDNTLQEINFKGGPFILIEGFVSTDEPMKLYKYGIKQLVVGNIDLGRQSIWVTFDDRITENVLGLDILSQITYYQESGSGVLHLFKDKKEATTFLNGIISRVHYRAAYDLYYVVIDGVQCYFKGDKIKRDAAGFYITLRNQKCYLK